MHPSRRLPLRPDGSTPPPPPLLLLPLPPEPLSLGDPHAWHTVHGITPLPNAYGFWNENGNENGAAACCGLCSYSGEVDQPWRDVISNRRRCLSEDPERTYGGLKSIEAMLFNKKIVKTLPRAKQKIIIKFQRTHEYGGFQMYARAAPFVRPIA
jgi:hypothetical protein